MDLSRLSTSVYRRCYLASKFLRRHRVWVLLGAFVFCVTMLARAGFFHAMADVNVVFQVVGILWMTVLPAVFTYLGLRFVLWFVGTGYQPSRESDENGLE